MYHIYFMEQGTTYLCGNHELESLGVNGNHAKLLKFVSDRYILIFNAVT